MIAVIMFLVGWVLGLFLGVLWQNKDFRLRFITALRSLKSKAK